MFRCILFLIKYSDARHSSFLQTVILLSVFYLFFLFFIYHIHIQGLQWSVLLLLLLPVNNHNLQQTFSFLSFCLRVSICFTNCATCTTREEVIHKKGMERLVSFQNKTPCTDSGSTAQLEIVTTEHQLNSQTTKPFGDMDYSSTIEAQKSRKSDKQNIVQARRQYQPLQKTSSHFEPKKNHPQTQIV